MVEDGAFSHKIDYYMKKIKEKKGQRQKVLFYEET